jgi:DNA ligase (NAD+)
MDIDGLGQETIDLLYQEGLIKSIADFYRLQKEQLVQLERMGEKSAERILAVLEASKSVPFERVLFALVIRFVGETVAKTLVKNLHSIDQNKMKTKEELTEIDEMATGLQKVLLNIFRNRNISKPLNS